VLADILRTHGHRHRSLSENSELAEAIAVLVRAHWQAQHTRQYHYNRLRSLLREFHPAALTAWADLPGRLLRPEARAVLRLAPTPISAARLTTRQLRRALSDAGRTPNLDDHAERLHTLFHTKVLRRRPGVETAMGVQALACLDMLDLACATVDALAGHIEDAFRGHPQAKVYLSFPGVGVLTGARLLAKIGDDPLRFADARGLRAYAGAAPLTWASSTSTSVTHRRIANLRLKATGHLGIRDPDAFGGLPGPLRPPPRPRRPLHRLVAPPVRPAAGLPAPLPHPRRTLRRTDRVPRTATRRAGRLGSSVDEGMSGTPRNRPRATEPL
jgi:transposase